MKFKDALTLIKEYANLIGQQYNCETIEDLLIVPTNPSSREKYVIRLRETLNPQKAIVPFIDEDVDVHIWTGKSHLVESNLLCSTNITYALSK